MQTLLRLSSDVEVYSIDGAFADLSGFTHHDLREYTLEMRRTVKQWTGIPVSIGPGPTKTLAKIANRAAEKAAGVLVLNDSQITKAVPVLPMTWRGVKRAKGSEAGCRLRLSKR